MKTWYRAACDKHKEFCVVFVTNPSSTATYLSEYDKNIQCWLTNHYGCDLRFTHTDEQLDDLYERDYIQVDYKTYDK